MRTDTKQLRKAEEELSRQSRSLNRILMETEQIQIWLKRNTSLGEMAHHLKLWSAGVENEQRGMMQLTLALDNIARLYEKTEKEIIDYAERPILPAKKYTSTGIQWISSELNMRYKDVLQMFGGEESEN